MVGNNRDTGWDDQVKTLINGYEGITRERYSSALEYFRTWYLQTYGEPPDLALLTDEEVRDYRVYLSGVRGLQASTVNTYLAPVRAAVRALGRTLRVKGIRRVPATVDALDGRELGRLLAAVEGPDWQDKRNSAVLALLARAGLRVSEALDVVLTDLELSARSGTVLIRHGKGGKERQIPLSAEARRVLGEYLAVRPNASTTTLFLSRTLQPLSARDLQRLVTTASYRAGIAKQVTPHVLRHTFATRFLQRNNGDIATLASLLGHSNVSTTTRYLHPDSGRVQHMVDDL